MNNRREMIDMYDLLYYEAFGSFPKDYEKQKKEYYKSYKERKPMKDNNGIFHQQTSDRTGFPIALVVQIILAIISYLLTKATAKTDREYLVGLSKELREKTGIEYGD